ncbi:MAG: glycosyltransferase family 2 protein [Planctomycetes bacterium]|nr:glycosyltransferase family 2 protein [Planctomycetota bacterium]
MTPEAPRVLVVIPAYNEAGRIGEVVRAVREVLPEANVVVVDDASSDDTAGEAAGAGAEVLSHAVNLGYGAGLESGYRYALARGYGIVLQMDADGQHIAGELPVILEPVRSGEVDLVIGSRYIDGGCGYHTPFVRRAGQKIFAGIIRLFSGMRITDPTSGFQCLGIRAIRLYASEAFPYDVPDADILLLAYYAGLGVREVPVKMVERAEGTSMHSGLKPVYYTMRMLLSIFIVVLGFRRWKRYVS